MPNLLTPKVVFLFQCFTGLACADAKQFDAKIHLKVNNGI